MDVVVENNGWSMQSSIDQRRCSVNLEGIAESVGLCYLEGGKDTLSLGDSRSPRIIEFNIETLGSTLAVNSQTGAERTINYHSGALLDGLEREHYSDFFEMSPLDTLSRALITSSFQSQFEEFISPLTKKYDVEGFI